MAKKRNRKHAVYQTFHAFVVTFVLLSSLTVTLAGIAFIDNVITQTISGEEDRTSVPQIGEGGAVTGRFLGQSYRFSLPFLRAFLIGTDNLSGNDSPVGYTIVIPEG